MMRCEIRELTLDDINQDFFMTLENLSKLLKRDINKTKNILAEIKNNSNHKFFVAISEDCKVIGLTTLLIERKIIENFGKFGHIEDVVVRRGYEKQGIGSLLVKRATEEANKSGCYQVRLCCSDTKIRFYRKQGYRKDGNSMIIDFKRPKQ